MPEPEAKFQRLLDGPHLDDVVANRAYLSVAVPDAPRGAGERWALTCLPATGAPGGGRRFSAVNMRWMETIVLYRPRCRPVPRPRQPAPIGAGGGVRLAGSCPGGPRARSPQGSALPRYPVRRLPGAWHRRPARPRLPERAVRRRRARPRLVSFTSRTAYAWFHNPQLTVAVVAGTGRDDAVLKDRGGQA